MKIFTFGIALVLASAAFNVLAEDDMWGCTCILCLSNPSGPTAVSECVPPIEKLWAHLKKGKDFPDCEKASTDGSGKNYARVTNNYFDECPAGTTMVDPGAPPTGGDTGSPTGRPRLCGTNLVGTHMSCTSDSGCDYVPVYEKLYSLSLYQYSGAIDVYMNDKFYTRVHWQDNAWSGSTSDAIKQSRKGELVTAGTCVGVGACAAGGTLSFW